MRSILVSSCLAAAALVAAAPAAAQNVYRCGNEYTRVPCPEGRAIETKNSATARQQAEADLVARREAQLGDKMQSDRLRNERAQRPALAANIGPRAAPPPASASLKPKKKARAKIRVVEGDDFTARAPKAPKK